jgi:hypothetical protein
MNEPHYFLTCFRLPARVDADGAASILGFQTHDIPILIGQKLLKPLGKPSAKSVKYFSTAELLTLSADRSWLDRATKAISDAWRQRNEAKANVTTVY